MTTFTYLYVCRFENTYTYAFFFKSVCFLTTWTFPFRCFASFHLRKRLHGSPLKSDALSGLVGGGGARQSRALHRRRRSVWGPAVSPSTAPKRGWHCRGLAPKWIRNIAFNLKEGCHLQLTHNGFHVFFTTATPSQCFPVLHFPIFRPWDTNSQTCNFLRS